jgi:Rrf2 family protein
MKMTTRGRYGLRAVLELARCYNGPPVLASTLARRERLSLKYLQSLLAAMRSAGIVRSVRGVGGGFQLARPPLEIRLGEVLRAVEGPLSLVDCVTRAGACSRSKDCTARRVWQALSGTISETLDGVTLESLVEPSEIKLSGPHRTGMAKENQRDKHECNKRRKNKTGRHR